MSAQKRVLIKISGESLKDAQTWMSPTILNRYIELVVQAVSSGIQVGIVIGGGNIVRGSDLSQSNLVSRSTADQIGMLATLMNALCLQEALSEHTPSMIMSARHFEGYCSIFNATEAKQLLSEKVLIFAGGTGNPFFSTDTCAALRAIEIDSDCLIKLTDVGGVYTEDPKKNKKAVLMPKLSFKDVLDQRYAVMDLAAFDLCHAHNMPIYVTSLSAITSIADLLNGKNLGTVVQ